MQSSDTQQDEPPKNERRLARSSFFIVVLTIYPILFIASANPGQASWRAVAGASAIAALVALAVLIGLRRYLRSWSAAGVGSAVLVALFYAYGPVHGSLELLVLNALDANVGLARINAAIAQHLHLLLTICWGGVAWICFRALRDLPEHRIRIAASGLSTMALILLVMVCGQFAFQMSSSSSSRAEVLPPTIAVGSPPSQTNYPDIYLIVLDGYARNDVLKQHYAFDNTEFLNNLKSRGFAVNDGSTANYYWTFLSLASLLNLQYLHELLPDQISPGNTDRGAAYEAIRNSVVHQFLKAHGYHLIHFQSTWGATLRNPYADTFVPCRRTIFQDEFFRAVAEASWLKILQPVVSTDLAQCHIENLRNLPRFASEEEPKFVLAHFLPPHYPYLFDREGNVLRDANLSSQFEFQKTLWEERQMYVDQLRFINGQIVNAIDRIVAQSRRPPIIILQSDHGPNISQGLSAEEQRRVRFANFSAVLLPDASPSLMPSDVSAVNVFRHVFNYYLGTDLEILPSRYYFSGFRTPYNFVEVPPPDVTQESESLNSL